jgi:hypothetical protein
MKYVLAGLIGHGVLAVLLIGCTGGKSDGKIGTPKADTSESVSPVIAGFETAGQIKRMSPCRAALKERQPCCAVFQTPDGKRFAIGSPAAGEEVVRFLATLNEGAAYAFPTVFLDYLKSRWQEKEQ